LLFSSENELGTTFGISRKDTQRIAIFELCSSMSNNVRSRMQIVLAFIVHFEGQEATISRSGKRGQTSVSILVQVATLPV
jgi:hypothetical protein